MRYREITGIELIEGGNAVRQGHYFSQGYFPLDVNGERINLARKEIKVTILNMKKIAYETIGEFDEESGVLRYEVTEDIGYGDMNVEFTVTDPADADYRQKFPTNEFDGKIRVNKSSDSIGDYGISSVTLDQVLGKQRTAQSEYEAEVDNKIEVIQTGFTSHKNEIGLVVEDIQQKAAGAVEATGAANTAASNANTAAGTANQAAGNANEAADNADQKATLAGEQAAYAKAQGDYVEEKKPLIDKFTSEQAGVQAQIDAHEADAMPHLLNDVTENKKVKIGMELFEGNPRLIFEEVVI